MYYLLVFLHLLVSIVMIGIVLLQSGKGAEMGASFGAGGSQSVFGAGGGSTFMSKATTSAAIIFMLTSLTLAYISGHAGSSSMMPKKVAPPAQQSQPGQGGFGTGAPGAMTPPAQSQQAAPAAPQAPAQQAPAPAKK